MSDFDELQAELSNLSEQQVTENSLKGTLVDEFLMHQPREVQIQVRETLRITGISPNDPYFLMLLQSRVTQILYQLTPNKIYEAFDLSQEKLLKLLNDFKTELKTELNQSQTGNSEKLALSVSTAKKARSSSVIWENFYVRSFCLFSLCLICSGAIGLFLNQTAIAKARKQNLAQKDQAILKWAKSEEGQVAKNIIDWNADLMSGDCKEKVKSLGISFQLENTKTTSGFCVLYVEPLNQRNTTTTD